MDEVKIGYRPYRVVLAMFVVGFFALCPFIFALTVPGFYSIENSSIGDILLVYGLMAFMFSVGAFFSYLFYKKAALKKPAIVLSKQGIWSNVTSWSERYYDWEDVIEAKIHSTSSGKSVRLVTTEKMPETKQRSRIGPGCLLWHAVLDTSAQALVDTINQFIAAHKAGQNHLPQSANTTQEIQDKAA